MSVFDREKLKDAEICGIFNVLKLADLAELDEKSLIEAVECKKSKLIMMALLPYLRGIMCTKDKKNYESCSWLECEIRSSISMIRPDYKIAKFSKFIGPRVNRKHWNIDDLTYVVERRNMNVFFTHVQVFNFSQCSLLDDDTPALIDFIKAVCSVSITECVTVDLGGNFFTLNDTTIDNIRNLANLPCVRFVRVASCPFVRNMTTERFCCDNLILLDELEFSASRLAELVHEEKLEISTKFHNDYFETLSL